MTGLLLAYRVVVVRGDEVVQGILHPGLDAGDPRVRSALDAWGGSHFLHQTPEGTEVTLVRPARPARSERWWLHGLLAALTLLTVTLAGAYFAGRDPLPARLLPLGPIAVPLPGALVPSEILPGLALSVPLLAILLAHELGHYWAARRYGMDVSPPYFIPAPPWLNFVGTFGAFIRLRSAMINRTMLLDVGAAGPVASFLLSVPALALGLAWSEPVGLAAGDVPARFVVLLGGYPIWLGGSLVVEALAALVGAGDGVLALHPLAFAGWLGFFVTAMNLFPLAQLDGGHVLYALVGPRQRWIGLLFLGLLVALGNFWVGWWVWAALILVLGRGVVRHPPVFDEAHPLSPGRRRLGWACVAMFVLTFVPLPLQA